jgi:hypothetical protein
MKITPTHPIRSIMKRHFPAILAAALSLLCAPSAFSQRTPAPLAPAEAVAAPAEKRFDIQLDGGLPAQEAIARIAEKLKHPVNIIFTGDSAETPLPALRLHQVTLPEFFAAIHAAGRSEAANGRAGYAFAPVDGAPNIYTFAVHAPPQPSAVAFGSAGQAFTATVFDDGASAVGAAPPAPDKSSLFFDLSTVLHDKLKIEDIITAIRTAWAAAEDGKEAPLEALRFHQDTKLLIATGFRNRLDIVTSIVKLLQERNQPSKDEKLQEIDRLARSRAEAEDQYNRMAKKLEVVELERDAQVNQLRSRIAELEIELAKRGKAN